MSEHIIGGTMRFVPTGALGQCCPNAKAVSAACHMVSSDANEISSVRLLRLDLDEELRRVVWATTENPNVRLVLRAGPSPRSAELVIERALPPIDGAPSATSRRDGLLARLWPRHPRATTAAERRLP